MYTDDHFRENGHDTSARMQPLEVEGTPAGSTTSNTGLLTAPRFFSMTRAAHSSSRSLLASSQPSEDISNAEEDEGPDAMKEVGTDSRCHLSMAL